MPSIQVQRAMQHVFLVGGITDKSFFEINSKIKVSSSWLLMRMDPLLNLLCKTWLSFLNDKVKITIRKAGQSSKSTILISHITWQVVTISYLHLHMIWMIEHCCVEVKACGENTRLELCSHHCGWDIVVQADAAQMDKCCDPLGSGMSTSMYSSGFCLITSDTIMGNIYDGEPSTWIKCINFHNKTRQRLGQQICRKAIFTSIQSVRPRSEI